MYVLLPQTKSKKKREKKQQVISSSVKARTLVLSHGKRNSINDHNNQKAEASPLTMGLCSHKPIIS